MFEDDFFDKWLDQEANRVKEKIQSGEALKSDDKIMLILKGQANHFHHLDVELRQDMIELREDMSKEIRELRIDMDKRFEQVDKRFEQVDKRFEQVDKRFEQVDKRFETLQEDVKKLYIVINNQTWRMIGAVGAIVVLSRVVDLFA